MVEVSLKQRETILPLAVYDVPDLHLFFLSTLQHLYLVVKVFDRTETSFPQLKASANLAITLLLHLDAQGLLSFGPLHPRNQVD